MKYFLLLLLVLGGLSLVMMHQEATARVQAKPARTLQVTELNTKAFACDGVNREISVDLTGKTIHKIYLWYGASGGTNADIVVDIENVKGADWTVDGNWVSIAKAGWDRYAEPTGVAGQTLWFDYTPYGLTAYDVHLFALCNPLNEETKGKQAHIIAKIYYTP